MATFTAEQLATMPAEDLAARYFYELDEDPEGTAPLTQLLKGEADRRGLLHEHLLELWQRLHQVD